VPFYGHIDQPCEEALRELEKRGYPVRRIGGYAAIDQARNKMATDALIDGFDETMWIDADVAFQPKDIDRIRSHNLPIVTGICPKKGKQELALHILPGTKRIVFGKQGGLTEVKYAGTGFLHVRREVYERIQYDLNLPVCNERFPRPVLPFFQPLIYEDAEGPWYLGEDWSFCERARQCGYRIFADSVIRLWHIGNYRYGWEDAGNKLQRYSDFTLNLSGKGDQAAQVPEDSQVENSESSRGHQPEPANSWGVKLARLQNHCDWPTEKPAPIAFDFEDRLDEGQEETLRGLLNNRHQIILILCASRGLETRFVCEQLPKSTIIAVDRWSDDKPHSYETPQQFEKFLINCWDYRNRILPLSVSNSEGLRALAAEQITPDAVYFNDCESLEQLSTELELALTIFPRAKVFGDGWNSPSVQRTLKAFAAHYGLRAEEIGAGWRLRGLATGHSIVAT
jgi:hypothetical protein